MAPSWEFILNCMPHLVWQQDAHGNACYTNARWREYAGHASDTSKWAQLVHPDDFTVWSKRADASSESLVRECRIRKQAEVEAPYLWHKVQSYYQDGETINIAVDIHNEKLLALELEELRAKEIVLHQLVTNSNDPVVTFDAHCGTIESLNRAAERAFQYPTVELVGRSLNLLLPRSYTIAGPSAMITSCTRNGARGKLVTVGGGEPLAALRRDGERIPVTLSLTQYSVDNKQLYVAILCVTSTDISKQQELRSSKDSFLRTMSHELRTPLFGLLGTLSTILEDTRGTLSNASSPDCSSIRPDESAYSTLAQRRDEASSLLLELGVRVSGSPKTEMLSSIDRVGRAPTHRTKSDADLVQMEACTRSLLSVVNNIITYYKIDLAVAPLSMPVQMRTLMREVCGHFESCVQDGVQFSHQVNDKVPQTVISDGTLLRHLLANLVSNSLRFTHKGSVIVVVDVVEPSISDADQVQLRISVEDTGIGIAPEFFSQVFQPFSQMDNSHSRKYDGAGLGLAVCKRIVDLLGGTISFNSGLGFGTVFEISMPVSLKANALPEAPDTQADMELFHLSSSQPFLCSYPTVIQTSPTAPSSPEVIFQPLPELHELEKRHTRSGSVNRKTALLPPILESDTETCFEYECIPRTRSGSSITSSMRSSSDSPDLLEDYTFPPRPSPAITRKSSASAPASPRVQSVHPPAPVSPVPTSSRFLRRPSFPFTLDDPSLGLMIVSPSPTISSCSSLNNSPSSSPRPALTQTTTTTPTTTAPQVFPLHMRVLVVDDNLVNQNVLKKMLKHMECLVTTAQHGRDALNILFDPKCPKYVGYNNFDLILMDCQMPVMDGLQATKAIRNWETENNYKNKIRIISLSASGSSETEKQCFESGSDGFIAKPVTLQGLCQVLSERTIDQSPPSPPAT